MLWIGDDAPDFEVPDGSGGSVRLRERLAAGPLVLYFYPSDFTPVCTKEACLFRDVHEDLARAGVRVLSVSPQGSASHERFRGQHTLPFPLLSDPEKRIARLFGVVGLLGLYVHRVSYLISPEGKIVDAAKGDLRLGPHRDFVSRVLARHRGQDEGHSPGTEGDVPH
jgi:peroxiredoxin Q/BCP